MTRLVLSLLLLMLAGEMAVVCSSISEFQPICTIQRPKPNNPNWEIEDRVIHQQFITDGDRNYRLQAVFDGHGSNEAAQFLKENFAYIIRLSLSATSKNAGAEELQTALQQAINLLDFAICESNFGTYAGSTGTFILHDINSNRAVVGNVGDSRTMVVRASDGGLVFATRDHKPDDPFERVHILSKGGKVSNGRVYCANWLSLAVSRAFGDCLCKVDHKSRTLSYDPDGIVQVAADFQLIENVGGEDLIVLSASDGLFDVIGTNQIKQYLRILVSLEEACQFFINYAVENNYNDDISIIINKF